MSTEQITEEKQEVKEIETFGILKRSLIGILITLVLGFGLRLLSDNIISTVYSLKYSDIPMEARMNITNYPLATYVSVILAGIGSKISISITRSKLRRSKNINKREYILKNVGMCIICLTLLNTAYYNVLALSRGFYYENYCWTEYMTYDGVTYDYEPIDL